MAARPYPYKLGIVGASGRTGKHLATNLRDFPELVLECAIVSPGSALCGSPVEGCQGTHYSADLAALEKCDVVVEFASAAISVQVAEHCSKKPAALIVATTGHTESERRMLESYADRLPLLVASNTSIGIYTLRRLAAVAAEILGPGFDTEVFEIHHRHKKDAPSGTALTLLRDLAGQSPPVDRVAAPGPRAEGSVGISALRGGEEPGEHTVYFFGPGERLCITHQVQSRAIFARGALELARRLASRAPGAYKIEDLLHASR